MDSYVDRSRPPAAAMVMLAKGNRSKAVTEACKKHGGFYLGSIGGPAARLAQDCIKKVEVLEYPELGMEAVWKIEVVDFPAFIVVDDKGNDFFAQLDAALGAGLAREARVLTPHLRALAAGAPDHTLFASLAALAPVVTADQRATTTALGRVLAALTATAPTCPTCATAADDAADLACALAAHHRFTLESLLPRARTRELALGPDPVR
jgi:hypothetical protein